MFSYICWWLVILFWKYLFGGLFFLKLWATEQNLVTSLTVTNYWKISVSLLHFNSVGLFFTNTSTGCWELIVTPGVRLFWKIYKGNALGVTSRDFFLKLMQYSRCVIGVLLFWSPQKKRMIKIAFWIATQLLNFIVCINFGFSLW